MKTRLTLILVLLIYIGAASHTRTAKESNQNHDDSRAGRQPLLARRLRSHGSKHIENSGMFKVDFAFTPDFGGDIATFKPDFHQCRIPIVINYGGAGWDEPCWETVADGRR